MEMHTNEDKAHETRQDATAIFPGMFLEHGSKPEENKRLGAIECRCSHPGTRRETLRDLRNLSEYYFRKDFSEERFRLLDGSYLVLETSSSGWHVENDGHTLAKGRGLPSLLAYLFGAPEEVAFIRQLEDATGCSFDAEASALFQSTYRDWMAAGRPERPAP